MWPVEIKMKSRPVVAVTAGDVAGIGPEVIVRALAESRLQDDADLLLIGHPEIFRRAILAFGLHASILSVNADQQSPMQLRAGIQAAAESGRWACWNPADDAVLNAPQRCVSAVAGDGAYRYLVASIQLARTGHVDAVATAPLNKESLHLAGHHYPGHTEILAEHCGVSDFAMMLHLPETAIAPWRRLVQGESVCSPGLYSATHGLSIAHVTLHTSVASVPLMLTESGVIEKIHLMADFLSGIRCVRRAIAVCALNPHGGENGLFGNEERTVIQPAVEKSRRSLTNLYGPLPVDTLIRRAVAGEFDGVIAMYHDQGHIPVKMIGFDSAINITLGLPMIRTSPTHGTAFDRAWNPSTPADANGMKEAIRMAVVLADARASDLSQLP